MYIISRNPHTLQTKYHAVTTYRNTNYSVNFICRKYKCSKASLMRWNKKFDGTKESLIDKSHRPLSKHPKAHTEYEITKIKNLIRRNPDIGLIELYSKLRTEIGYTKHYTSLYRFLKKNGFYGVQIKKTTKYSPKPYHTPDKIGEKWQMDVKYVPKSCYAPNIEFQYKFYQYTIIDEASRERFIYPYQEQSSYSTCDFIMRAIAYFGYKPHTIQTDNGFEFTYFKETNKIHPVDILLASLNIEHKLIRPRTPRHNGKVERSHRNDQERFYNHMSFYSYEDLKQQMKRYLYRSNRIVMSVLDYKTPIEKRHELINNNLVNYNI